MKQTLTIHLIVMFIAVSFLSCATFSGIQEAVQGAEEAVEGASPEEINEVVGIAGDLVKQFRTFALSFLKGTRAAIMKGGELAQAVAAIFGLATAI